MKAINILITSLLIGFVLMKCNLWWGIFPATVLSSFFFNKESRNWSIAMGILAGILLWLIWSFWLYYQGGDVIANRISELFGGLPSVLFIALTSLIPVFLSALGILCGRNLKALY